MSHFRGICVVLHFNSNHQQEKDQSHHFTHVYSVPIRILQNREGIKICSVIKIGQGFVIGTQIHLKISSSFYSSQASPKKEKMSEEETEGIDWISNLPKPLLHHIMYFLPPSETTTLMFVSKSFLSTYRSSPFLDFDYYSKFRERSMRSFSDFVLESLQRHMLVDTNLLRLSLTYGAFVDDEAQNLLEFLERFIIHKKVQHLILNFQATDLSPYLSDSFFSLQSIKTISLQGLSFETPSLILSCPFLESFTLRDCSGIKSFEVSNSQLKSVEFSHCNELEVIRIIEAAATSLQSFSYGGDSLEQPQLNIEITSSESLKTLALKNISNIGELLGFSKFTLLETLILMDCREGITRNININSCTSLKFIKLWNTVVTEDWFSANYSALQFVESFKLGHCPSLRRFDLKFEHLKEFELLVHWELSNFIIEAPKLDLFTYSPGRTPPHPPVVICSNFNANLQFHNLSMSLSPDGYYKALRDFLVSFDHCKTLTIACSSQEVLIFPEIERSDLFSPLYDLKHLHIMLKQHKTMIETFLESLLWLAPRLNTLSITLDSKDSNVQGTLQFYYKDFELVKEDNAEDHEDELLCCDPCFYKCWRHCVKKVVMKNFAHYNDSVQSFFRKNVNDIESIDIV